jgi:hypothetical protein
MRSRDGGKTWVKDTSFPGVDIGIGYNLNRALLLLEISYYYRYWKIISSRYTSLQMADFTGSNEMHLQIHFTH